MESQRPYILMLEDDGDDRYITESFFKERNYKIDIEFFVNPDDILPHLEQRRSTGDLLPRVILLDKNVPAGGGMEVLRSLKSHDHFRSIPVVMISGSPFASDIAESYRLGANSFIAKPFTSEHTAQTIESFVHYWFNVVDLPDL